MKKNEVKVGCVYRAKVGRNVVEVRVDAENPHGGWDAVSLSTGKAIRVKSAQRLRATSGQAMVKAAAKKAKAGVVAEEVTAPTVTTTRTAPQAAPGAKGEAKATKDATAAPEAPTAPQGAKKRAPRADGKLSGLDAAAQVLGEAGTPLNAKEMVDTMLAKGLWTTGGRTPAATIYAAILREIQQKGDQSRFVKAERGKFALAR